MKDIAVVGKSEFTLGFRLTGIKNVVETNNAKEDIVKFLNNDKIGIVIMDEKTMEELDDYTKELVVGSISPVFVVVSETAQQDELRKMIIQSIGVDLMKDED
ncbi:MAG: V-type ATP synthase subunit F [Candidatus Woesearchaeota archaeon]